MVLYYCLLFLEFFDGYCLCQKMHDEGVCLQCQTCDETWNSVVVYLIGEVQLVVFWILFVVVSDVVKSVLSACDVWNVCVVSVVCVCVNVVGHA